MYIWNLKKLIQAFQNGQITAAHEKKNNLIFFILFIGAIFLLPDLFESNNLYDIIDFVRFSLFTIFGTYWAYRINKKGDQKDFWLRFFMLFIPIAIRAFLLSTILSVIGYALFIFIPTPLTFYDETNLFDVSVSLVTDIYFFYLMFSSFKQISFHSIK